MLILSILLVVLIFGLLIFVHELGHFVAARRSGIEVEEFGFGFPPRVIGKKVGGTIYSINLLPLGGFVRLKGEDGSEGDTNSFAAAPYMTKVKVLLAGVGMNALIAYVILLVLAVTGIPPIVPNQFSLGETRYSESPRVLVVGVEDGSPAAQAGIKQGDTITSAGGEAITSDKELTSFTKENAGDEVEIKVVRGGEERSVNVQLKGPESKTGFLGVTPLTTYKQVYGWLSPIVAFGLLIQLMWLTLVGFGGLIAGLFLRAEVSNDVTGPVGIVVILQNIMQLGLSYLALFVASISVSLAVINALPIPALDGGRLAFTTVQRFSRRPLSQKTEAMVHATGFILLILLMLIVTIVDIQRIR